MDPNNNDFQYHPPSQDPPEPARPDNDYSGAEIARAKLNSIYGDDSAKQPDAQPQPEAPQQSPPPAQQPSGVSDPNDPSTFHVPGAPRPPEVIQPSATPPSTPQPNPSATAQPNSFEEYAAQRFDTTHKTEQPQRPGYPPSQPTTPHQPQPQAQFQPQAQPTPQTHQPPIARLYQRETDQLNQSSPQHPHASPDHQLQAANPHYELPPGSGGSHRFSRLQPFFKTLALALFIALFYNNQLIMGKVQSYINPAQNVASPQIVDPRLNENIGKESRIVIPKINVDVPVVYDVKSYDDADIQVGLKRGVVHYGKTPLPGENGNNVIVGHSSNSFWNDGTYKFAFVLLDQLQDGDTFALHYNGQRYIYEVFAKEVVSPTSVEIAFEDYGEPVTTLITCTPPGTNWNRLAVVARQISPDPDEAKKVPVRQRPTTSNTIPGSPPSLWDNVRGWFD